MASNQYQNENLTVTTERKPGSKVSFSIEISPKAAQAAFHKAAKEINKQVSIPGFRKGKAPEKMIIQKYSNHVEQEWRDIAVNTAFTESMKLTQIYPYNEKAISRPQLKNLSQEEGGVLTIEFEAYPEIPEIDPSLLDLKEVPVQEVTEEKISNALEDIQFQHAEWEEIEGRPVEENDYVQLTIENIEKEEPSPLFNSTRFRVDEENMGNWMRKLVIGKNPGDQVEGVSEKEAKDDEESKFKPTKLRISIEKIEKANLPELNDAFAEKLGLESFEKMKEKVRSELESFAKEEQQEQMRTQLVKEVLKNYHIDLPSIMIAEDVKRSSDAAINRVKALAEEGENLTEKIKIAAEEAATSIENGYKCFLIFRKIADDNQLHPSSRQVMQELMRQMFMVQPSERVINPEGDPQESQSRIHAYLTERMAQDWLIEKALQKEEKAWPKTT